MAKDQPKIITYEREDGQLFSVNEGTAAELRMRRLAESTGEFKRKSGSKGGS